MTSHYDSMIAKIVVMDESRSRAIQKMIETLKETVIFGVKTNIPYLIEILKHRECVDGKMTTQFIDKYFPNGLKPSELDEDILSIAELIRANPNGIALAGAANLSGMSTSTPHHQSPWLIGGR